MMNKSKGNNMSILESLGLSRKAKPKEVKPIQLHPECMSAHGTLVSLYLAGKAVEVLNPDGEWEECEQPIFGPQYQYRLANVTTSVWYNPPKVNQPSMPTPSADRPCWSTSPPQRMDAAPSTLPTDIPAPVCKYKRGDVWTSSTGNEFLVLGNKYGLIANYSTANDPDSGALVVMRINSPKGKNAVSCRSVGGLRSDNNPAFALKTKTGTFAIGDVDPYLKEGLILLTTRVNAKDVYLDANTGEVKFR